MGAVERENASLPTPANVTRIAKEQGANWKNAQVGLDTVMNATIAAYYRLAFGPVKTYSAATLVNNIIIFTALYYEDHEAEDKTAELLRRSVERSKKSISKSQANIKTGDGT